MTSSLLIPKPRGRCLPAPLLHSQDRSRYSCSTAPDSLLWAQVLNDQWKAHLGMELKVVAEESVWVVAFKKGRFRHFAEAGSSASYLDPVWFLELFSRQGGYGTSWSDPVYDRMVADAKTTSDPALRLSNQPKLRKRFVKGLGSNLLNHKQPKYAWIDTNWRPQ